MGIFGLGRAAKQQNIAPSNVEQPSKKKFKLKLKSHAQQAAPAEQKTRKAKHSNPFAESGRNLKAKMHRSSKPKEPQSALEMADNMSGKKKRVAEWVAMNPIEAIDLIEAKKLSKSDAKVAEKILSGMGLGQADRAQSAKDAVADTARANPLLAIKVLESGTNVSAEDREIMENALSEMGLGKSDREQSARNAVADTARMNPQLAINVLENSSSLSAEDRQIMEGALSEMGLGKSDRAQIERTALKEAAQSNPSLSASILDAESSSFSEEQLSIMEEGLSEMGLGKDDRQQSARNDLKEAAQSNPLLAQRIIESDTSSFSDDELSLIDEGLSEAGFGQSNPSLAAANTANTSAASDPAVSTSTIESDLESLSELETSDVLSEPTPTKPAISNRQSQIFGEATGTGPKLARQFPNLPSPPKDLPTSPFSSASSLPDLAEEEPVPARSNPIPS